MLSLTMSSSSRTPKALAILGKMSERGGFSLHSQKAMFGCGVSRNSASSF